MTPSEYVAAVDAFLAAPKLVIGADGPLSWQAGRDADELCIKLPLEMNGETAGQRLMVSYYPTYPNLKFRLGVLFEPCVSRLDYELDATHGNNFAEPRENLPPVIRGPHYHSWPINRRFVTSTKAPLKLSNALPLAANIRQFDATLRWFCADNNIILPGGHTIVLPEKGMLI